DLHANVPQDAADRLDSECTALDDPIAVGVDVVNDHRDRHLPSGYLILRSSSAAAKKAALVFRISFARRSSRTSRSSSVIRAWSSVLNPGRIPPSTSACRTQFRNASGWTPQLVGDPFDRPTTRLRVLPRIQRH